MVTIAMVDSSGGDREQLRQWVEEYFLGIHTIVQLEEYHNAERFLERFMPGDIDLLFLETDLDGEMDGMVLARTVWERDKYCKQIFCTVSPRYAVTSYEVRAADYILKPFAKERLHLALDFCVDPNLQKKKFIEVISNRYRTPILLRDIIYVTKRQNAVVFHTPKEELRAYVKFQEIAERLLSEDHFLQCYHGCIVNLDYVTSHDANHFFLTNGVELGVRKRDSSRIMESYRRYLVDKASRNFDPVESMESPYALL